MKTYETSAGGSIKLASTSASAVEDIHADLLRALHIEECRGQRLVSLREMLHNLHA